MYHPGVIARSQAARQAAEIVDEGFDTFYEAFKMLTRRCRQHFDARDWVGLHADANVRMDLYNSHVTRTLTRLEPIREAYPQDLELWKLAHIDYAAITMTRPDTEVAETFFNAITRKVFRTVGVKGEVEFLDPPIRLDDQAPLFPIYETIACKGSWADIAAKILEAARPALQWCETQADAMYLATALEQAAATHGAFIQFDVLKSLFFRVREAYIVGRMHTALGVVPLAIPVQPVEQGVVVDGCLTQATEVLDIFSSTRSYFFVDVERPADLVRFLASIMPSLTLSELYIAIAHHRHGKTVIYRELVEHLQGSSDLFITAPGIRGLVMTVFALPSYRNVFKLIRDRFDKPGATRAAIMTSYRDVFRGRRVGRLADTQEFEYLAFDRNRFSQACLNELIEKAAATVHLDGAQVVFDHVYIEERMTPLNIYIEHAPIDEAAKAMIDYGYAIKELAAHNIFAGDLLWKNFGVTRLGRVVLYDYDEICPLLACTFRPIPQSLHYDDELSATSYYAVAPGEVFPEEWKPFVVPRNPALQTPFMHHHADLFLPAFWQQCQQNVRAGEIYVGLPYTPRHRELQDIASIGPRAAPIYEPVREMPS